MCVSLVAIILRGVQGIWCAWNDVCSLVALDQVCLKVYNGLNLSKSYFGVRVLCHPGNKMYVVTIQDYHGCRLMFR